MHGSQTGYGKRDLLVILLVLIGFFHHLSMSDIMRFFKLILLLVVST